MAESRAGRRSLWLIANHHDGRLDVLTLEPGSEREALPIFSFEEEAEAFLLLETPGVEWRARRTTAGELTSLFYGPCASVKRAMLDPLPVVSGEVVFDLVGPGREDFLRNFVGGPPSLLKLIHTEEIKGPQLAKNGSARDGTQVQTNGSHVPSHATRDFDPSEDPGDNPDGHLDGHHNASGVSKASESAKRYSRPR